MSSDDAGREELLAQLDASRRVLLAALEGVTERDFGADLGGETVVQLLAAVAQAEREGVARARDVALEPRRPAKPMPPQVMHDLAGARHQTRRYVQDAATEVDVAAALVHEIEEREADAARRIRERPPVDPPPEIPVIQR